MSGFDELVDEFQKDYGERIGGKGYSYTEMQRIPTGYFPFDLATGGGIPMGKLIELYGMESSGKTNICLKLIANHQKLYPNRKCGFFDVENSFDPKWARRMGVDVDKLYVFKPDYGEQVVDMIEGLIGSPECGLVVIDSLAAMVTTREIQQSAEKQDVGGAGLLIGKLVRKVVLALLAADKEGRNPTVVFINQIRHKVGVMFGSPESTPGGFAPKFAASMRLRAYGKNIVDAKYHKHMPVRKNIKIGIIKWKCPIVAPSCEMEIAMIPHKSLKVGECDDWNLFKKYMQDYNLLEKAGSNWLFNGDKYSKLSEIREVLNADIKLSTSIKAEIITKEKDKSNIDESEEEEEEEEGKVVKKKTTLGRKKIKKADAE